MIIIVAEIRVVLKMCVLSYICSSSCCDDFDDDTKWCFVETCVALYFPSLCMFFPTVVCVTFFSTSKEET
jgi:hypothetical protein